MRAKGVDVSKWQGDGVDWKKLRENGISFAFLRATVGLRVDNTYQLNYRRAGEADILRGAYHYLYPHDVEQQAELLANTFQESELPPVLDVEQAELTEAHVRAFLNAFESITGRKAMVYTSMYKWHTLVGVDTPWASAHDLWVAHYTAKPEPLMPQAWPKWTFWQFTEEGQVPGYHGYIDMDFFNGDEDKLREYATIIPAPREPVKVSTDGFDFPCGWPDGEGYYVASGLAEQAYYDRFGAWHTGEDWNGLKYGDTDLGDAVHAVANGVVTASDDFPTSWGNIILIEHTMPNGDKVWSQYAHLWERMVDRGNEVVRGQQVGTIGKGYADKYWAHLHFEIRLRDLAPNAWNFSRDQVISWYAHPTEFIRAHRPGLIAVEITLDEESERINRAPSGHWNDSPVGYRGHSYWTHTLKGKEDCWMEWRPELPRTGLYEVMAFIPSQNATSKQARYEVTHRRGTDVVLVDQSRYFNQWVSLGRFPFSISPSLPAVVRLGDRTGEPYTPDKASRKQIAFDAMRFIPIEEIHDDGSRRGEMYMESIVTP